MSRALGQRLLIVCAAVLIGAFLLVGLLQPLLAAAPGWLGDLISIGVILLAAASGLVLDQYLSRKPPLPVENLAERQRIEAELSQLNQELSWRAQEQTNELSRLNVELQLQMAMSKQAEESARISEERFRNMADNIQEGLTILENGRLVYLNQRACDIFGDCPEGDIYDRLYRFAAPEEKEHLSRTLEKAKAEGSFPQELEYWVLREDGKRSCIREVYSTTSSNGIDRIFILTSDITESVQAYQTLENAVSDRTRELSTVLDVSRRIASTLELETLLNLILDQIGTIIPYIGAALFTLHEDALEAVAYKVPGFPAQDRPLILTLERAAPFHQVLLEKKVQIVDDIQGDTPLSRAFFDAGGQPSVFSFDHARSWIGIPLIVRDQVIGLLSLANDVPDYYTQRHARLAMTITNQMAIAVENARLYEHAQNLGVIEERHRIARELHDSVTQLLYGITLYSTAAARTIRGGNIQQVEQNLAEIKDNALQALQEMRLLILELDPPDLQKAGLVAALRTSLEMIETRTGLETELVAEGVHRFSRSVETELYRIALEALNNFVRYAGAKKVSVGLFQMNGGIRMEIRDDGVGFDLEKAHSSGGMGLHSMEQRARQIGGSLEISSSPGAGTRILVEAPLEEKWAESTLN